MSHSMLRAARRQAALASGQRLFSAVPALSTQDAPIRSGVQIPQNFTIIYWSELKA